MQSGVASSASGDSKSFLRALDKILPGLLMTDVGMLPRPGDRDLVLVEDTKLSLDATLRSFSFGVEPKKWAGS